MESKRKPRLRSPSFCLWFMLFFAASAPAGTLTNVQTVFLIVMENVNWSALKGNPSAPYINNTLVPMASYCEQYYTPPGLPGSLPNYLRSEEHTSELQSRLHLVCRLLLEKKKNKTTNTRTTRTRK